MYNIAQIGPGGERNKISKLASKCVDSIAVTASFEGITYEDGDRLMEKGLRRDVTVDSLFGLVPDQNVMGKDINFDNGRFSHSAVKYHVAQKSSRAHI